MPAESGRPAPLEHPFEAGLLLGSNIDPETHLPAALERIGALGTIVRVSGVWQTAPAGFADQPDFCNAAVVLQTNLSRDELRRQLRAIEDSLGRVRDPSNKNAPRTIDIDIAVWKSLSDATAPIEIDPETGERLFAALPLAGALPDLWVAGEPLIDIAARLRNRDAETMRLVHRPDIRL